MQRSLLCLLLLMTIMILCIDRTNIATILFMTFAEITHLSFLTLHTILFWHYITILQQPYYDHHNIFRDPASVSQIQMIIMLFHSNPMNIVTIIILTFVAILQLSFIIQTIITKFYSNPMNSVIMKSSWHLQRTCTCHPLQGPSGTTEGSVIVRGSVVPMNKITRVPIFHSWESSGSGFF